MGYSGLHKGVIVYPGTKSNDAWFMKIATKQFDHVPVHIVEAEERNKLLMKKYIEAGEVMYDQQLARYSKITAKKYS